MRRFTTCTNKDIIIIVPIPKPNKDIDKGPPYRPIPLLSVIADTGEEPSSLHNSKHTKHTHATPVPNITLYRDSTTHIKQQRNKGVKPNDSPCANNHCITRYEQSFRHNKHTYPYQKAATDQDSSTYCMAHVCFYVCCSDSVGVCGNVCCVAAVVKNSVFSLGVLKYVVCLCKGCDGCCVFCLYCDAWSCMCSCMGSVSVSSCRCCMFVSCVHPVVVPNAAFCMTCSVLMLVEDARRDHMEERYSRVGLILP